MARSGDNGVEDPLTAEHHVLEPRDRLDIHGAGGIHGRQISGIHHQGLTGVQIVFHDMPMHVGFEISQDVVDKNLDHILDEAENRRHAEKAVMYTLLNS